MPKARSTKVPVPEMVYTDRPAEFVADMYTWRDGDLKIEVGNGGTSPIHLSCGYNDTATALTPDQAEYVARALLASAKLARDLTVAAAALNTLMSTPTKDPK